MTETTATYLPLTADPNIDIARTIEINPDLHVDLDDDGHVLGIENIAGSIGVAELIEILRKVRVAGSEPTTTGDTDLKATLATLLGAIETHDTDYPTRYGLVLQALAAATLLGYPAGIGIDHASGTDMDGFRTVVYIELPTGQISWHMPEHPHEYDGHSTELKYQRCRAYADYVEHADEVTQ